MIFSAAICHVHFRAEDLIQNNNKIKLRIGAIPCLYLPKQTSLTVSASASRKEPKKREQPLPKIRFSSLQKIINAAEKLPQFVKRIRKI